MMWIWYLLLGSGSGSQTVGECLKQAGTKVSGVCVFFVCVTEPIRTAPRSGWGKGGGGLLNSLKCDGCAASFSSHSWTILNLLVHYIEELLLLFIFIGSGHIFWPQIESCGSLVCSGFFFSFSEPVESIPHGACPLYPSVF